MSLKALHICFIVLSILLALGFGIWAVRNFESSRNLVTLVLGAGSFVGSLVLTGYLFWFVSKMKKVGSE